MARTFEHHEYHDEVYVRVREVVVSCNQAGFFGERREERHGSEECSPTHIPTLHMASEGRSLVQRLTVVPAENEVNQLGDDCVLKV